MCLEGPQSWSHGTTKNVLSLAMLESSFQTDFGLNLIPGFSQTVQFRLRARGPSTGLAFNFADASEDLLHDAVVSWLSNKYSSEEGIAYSRRALEGLVNSSLASSGSNRSSSISSSSSSSGSR